MVTDLTGFWKSKLVDTIFHITRIDVEVFKVVETATKKEYTFHLSHGGENDGHLLSSEPFWNDPIIYFITKDLFSLSRQCPGQLGQVWEFERIENHE